jgi:hypothetical protein
MKADILAIFLENLPQVHGQRLEDHAQMLLVEEVPSKYKQCKKQCCLSGSVVFGPPGSGSIRN